MSKIPAKAEQAGVTCVANAFSIGPGYLAALHCIAAKERDAPLERMFADLGATPFAKTAPVSASLRCRTATVSAPIPRKT